MSRGPRPEARVELGLDFSGGRWQLARGWTQSYHSRWYAKDPVEITAEQALRVAAVYGPDVVETVRNGIRIDADWLEAEAKETAEQARVESLRVQARALEAKQAARRARAQADRLLGNRELG